MSLDNYIAKFPKGLVAFVFISFGIAFIVLYNPPKTYCDAEIEVFKNEHRNFLAPIPKSSQKLSQYDLQKDTCKRANGPGGCYEFFTQVRQLLKSIEGAPKECRVKIGEIPLVKKALWQTSRLLIHLAWGSSPPTSSYEKMGWLDYSDLNMFCRLQNKMSELYGDRAWGEMREEMFVQLPGAPTLPRDRAWSLMLLSVNCNQYQ